MQPPNLWDSNVGGRDSPSLWPRIRAAAGDLQGIQEPAFCLPNAPVSCESPQPQLRKPIYTPPPPGHPREYLSRDLLFLLRMGHGCHSAGRGILWLRWSHACTRSQALWVQSHWVAVAVVWPACLRPAGGRSGAASVLNLNSFLPSSAPAPPSLEPSCPTCLFWNPRGEGLMPLLPGGSRSRSPRWALDPLWEAGRVSHARQSLCFLFDTPCRVFSTAACLR